MNVIEVLYLPSWFPGMSFVREMEIASKYSKQYIEQAFEYALQKVVMISSMTYLFRACV